MVDLIPAVDYDLVMAQSLEVESHTPREDVNEAVPLNKFDVPPMKLLVTPALEDNQEHADGGDATSHGEYGRQVCLVLAIMLFSLQAMMGEHSEGSSNRPHNDLPTLLCC